MTTPHDVGGSNSLCHPHPEGGMRHEYTFCSCDRERLVKQNSLLVEALERIVKMTPSFTNIEAIELSKSALQQYRKGE